MARAWPPWRSTAPPRQHARPPTHSALPTHSAAAQASWRRLHPRHEGWRYRLWTDADNDALCARAFPWFLPTYKSLTGIMRADAARAMYL